LCSFADDAAAVGFQLYGELDLDPPMPCLEMDDDESRSSKRSRLSKSDDEREDEPPTGQKRTVLNTLER
jgi:hypothetical protein